MDRLFFKIRVLLTTCKWIFLSTVFIFNFSFASSPAIIPAQYDFEFIPQEWITMQDGIRLSINYWKPKSKNQNEKFPIVIEVLPYRKDDVHFISDYHIGRYFARRGIIFARIDIRGTGSSEGVLPDREYSDVELADIREILKQLAKKPWSNGKIGMQGISWSAFNSIMTAMQRPQELKGILIAHGSDDIYANDIHNIDGALHLDIFTIEIETDNLLPQSPHYQIDEEYFKNRFEQKPWVFSFLKHQRDSDFWQKNRSLRSDFSAITIPVYAFSALLDGYRDFAINMLKIGKAPIRVAVGPQNHAWPDSDPGPRYEWRQSAVQFWHQVLNDKETGFWQKAALTVFMRDPVPPDLDLKETPGTYLNLNWPVKDHYNLRLFPQEGGLLAKEHEKAHVDQLKYDPSAGNGVLNWWGETTPDMRAAAFGSLVYESKILEKDYYLLGNPEVNLKVSQVLTESNREQPKDLFAHWVVRLEDVHPNGSVSLITGGLMNSAERSSRRNPQGIKQGEDDVLKFPLHFTTWKFTKGHKIRLVISNAAFPMLWPTPEKMVTKLLVGDANTFLDLPLLPYKNYPKPQLPQVEKDDPVPDVKYLQNAHLTPFKITKEKNGNVIATAKESCTLSVGEDTLSSSYQVRYEVNKLNPANAKFIGEGEDSIHIKKSDRTINFKAKIFIHSDKKYFHTIVSRKIMVNGKLLKERSWKEDIPRDFE